MEKARILVVEDERIVAKDLTLRLQHLGHTVPATAASGREAVLKTSEIRPDLILMDIRLQGEMDGVEAASRIRAQHNVPIIYLTAHSDAATLQRAKVTEPFGYLLKNFDEHELQVAIEIALYKHRMEQALREREQWLTATLTSTGAAVVATDTQQRVTFMNPAAETLIGWVQEDALGHDVTEVCCLKDERTQLVLEHPVVKALREGVPIELTNHALIVKKDGTSVAIADSAAPVHDGQNRITGAILVLQDISARKQTELALQTEIAVSTVLARVGRELIGSLDTSTLLDHLCQLTAEALDCDASHTILRHPKRDTYTLVAGWGDSPEQWETLRALRFPQSVMAAILEHLTDKELLEVVPASLSAPLLKVAEQQGITRILFVALRRGPELLGLQTACYRGQTAPFSTTQKRIARGIAQLGILALENAQLLERAQEANRIKSDFLATMSHELRTPLNIILGYTQLLLEGEFGSLTTVQISPLQKIDINARQLIELVQALLDINRLEVGELPVLTTVVDVKALIEELQDETSPLLEKPHLRVRWQSVSHLPLLTTDHLKLKVIVKNLLNNALKFTDVGEVSVAAQRQENGIEISISDTGIGIEPELLSTIFEPFRQGESALTRRHRGVGLGLYIVKRLLDVLGGTITVNSVVGEGSVFRVWLPLTPPEN